MAEDKTNNTETPSLFERLTQMFGAEPRDRSELLDILRDAERRGLFDTESLLMLEGVFQVAEMRVRDIMIPRAQMDVVNHHEPLEKILPVVIESGHSRFPVIGDSRDEVLGVLLAKDLLRYFSEEQRQSFDLDDILRPPVFTPESKRLNILLKEFRLNRNHMAIVVDEYGGVAGLVTIEDVLEQIVGEIDDEHDVAEDSNIRQLKEKHYLVRALTPIDEFNTFFSAGLDEEEFDTIGGLVMNEFGHMPKRGEVITVGEFVFKVRRADSRRLHMLEVIFDRTHAVQMTDH